MLNGRHVTLTTGSMNRLSSLRRALTTWLALPEVDEIIIVDWGSKEPLRDALDDFRRDERVIIVRTEQKHWHNSKCHNLELQLILAKEALWLRLDNDTLVRSDFFAKHSHQEGSFYAVNWRTVPATNDDKRNLAGTLFVDPDYARKIQGYNERLIHYGHEDDDLHARLLAAGYRWREVVLETVEHLPHPDKARYENLAIAEKLSRITAPYKAKRGFAWADKLYETASEGDLEKTMLLVMSDQIAKMHPWTSRDRMTAWTGELVGRRYWEVTEKQAP